LILLLGPATADNFFPGAAQPALQSPDVSNTSALRAAPVHYVFQPGEIAGEADRHSTDGQGTNSFALSSYPTALQHLISRDKSTKNATTNLDTTNEQGWNVAVAVAKAQTKLADWVVLIEETHGQAFAPVSQLHEIILACVFATAGFIGLLVLPIAHYSVAPIRRLKSATEKSIQPLPQFFGGANSEMAHETPAEEDMIHEFNPRSEKSVGVVSRLADAWRGRNQATDDNDQRQNTFKIPKKVRERKHVITDELTELTGTFNEMADELMIQYTRLEERVAERTRELETAKKAAETANESKTLFIANISHELKTPLNGILGMCAVCMGEDDLPRIKKSLQVVYKSGDLLLHLLNDLLTFSKNEVDQAIRLDEKEFSLADIKSQILTIFQKQVQEKQIHFTVDFVNAPSPAAQVGGEILSEKTPLVAVRNVMGPPGTGRLKDIVLWGDQHRILQILINLVSNSLKFTPEAGRVAVRIRCLGDAERSSDTSPDVSMDSRHGSHARSRTPSFKAPKAETGPPGNGGISDHWQQTDGWRTPSPINCRTLAFGFEVEDSGPGIAPQFQRRVFEPFMQGDLGLSRKYGGTGLGLSICSQLSRLLGGNIGLESTVGKGTTFKLEIPLKYIKEISASMHSASTDGSPPPSATVSLDSSNGVRTGGNSPALTTVENQDSEPRLVGLSQPFFASAPLPVSNPVIGSDSKLQSLNQVTPVSGGRGKIRVLVAEDNAVNQEVVLR
jgi:osomolarity two-component system sensor histidine kinase SLN1